MSLFHTENDFLTSITEHVQSATLKPTLEARAMSSPVITMAPEVPAAPLVQVSTLPVCLLGLICKWLRSRPWSTLSAPM